MIRHAMLKTIFLLALGLAGLPPRAEWVEPAEAVALGAEALAGADRHGGHWLDESGVIRQDQATTETALLLFEDRGVNQYSIEARVRLDGLTTGSAAGLLLQARNPNHYLFYTLEQRYGGIYAVLGFVNEVSENPFPGGSSSLVEGAFIVDLSRHPELNVGQWQHLRADVQGAEVVCYLNGKPAARYWFKGALPKYEKAGRLWPADPVDGRVGLYSTRCVAEFADVTIGPIQSELPLATPLRGARDQAGKLLPLRSYDETMRLLNEWMITSVEVIDPDPAPASLRGAPPYLVSNWVTSDNRYYGNIGGEYGFNHSISILGAIQYYLYSGDARALEVARNLAEWHLEHRVPADAAAPHLVQSVVFWREDGSFEGMEWGLEMDKSAYMGLAFLSLHAITSDPRYLQGAREIASVLREYQHEEGNWPFRINALSGEVTEAYSCSQLWYVLFFEKLHEVEGDAGDLERSRKALQWLIDHPIKDNRWFGVYGDVAVGGESFDQWIPIETALYLLEHRDEVVGAVQMAEDILDYLGRELIVDEGFHPDVPGLTEQTTFPVVETIQQFRLAELYAKLYEATGREEYKDAAIAAANSTTWCQMSDGKMRQGLGSLAFPCPLVLNYNFQLCRIMACIPETAPRGEDHLLHNTSLLRRIDYADSRVSYETFGPGEEILTVRRQPAEVTSGGVAMNRLPVWGFHEEGWWYDEATGQLRVRHRAPRIEIRF